MFRSLSGSFVPGHRMFVRSVASYETRVMQSLWRSLLDKKYEKHNGLVTVVSLPKGVSWLTEEESNLFVRQCDIALFDIVQNRIQSGKKGVIITGNPGIGKSWFLSYCLLCFSQQKKFIFFQSVEGKMGWLFHPDGIVTPIEPPTLPYEIRNDPKNSIYLFDPATGDPTVPFGSACFTIVSTPPSRNQFRQFRNRTGNLKYYKPVWSWEEIASVLPFLPLDEQFVKGLFGKYGGIPRYIFSSDDSWNEELECALQAAKIDDIRDSLGGPELVSESSHKLLQYQVRENYSGCTVKLASEYVEKRLIEKFYQENRQEMLNFIKESQDKPMIAFIRGRFFENVAHRFLRSFGKFSYRSVDSKEVMEIEIKIERKMFFDVLEEIKLTEGIYYQPKHKNFPAIDSLCVVDSKIFLFQMTVSLDHPVLHSALEDTVAILQSDKKFSVCLVFVVPEDKFHQFSKQQFTRVDGEERSRISPTVQSIPQFVLKIPYITGFGGAELPDD